ncbi:MAG: iron-containing alcohol dehydrogenase family protein [Betaproteobacteria bacterium]
MRPTYTNTFSATSYPLRLHSGEGALEQLPTELKRLKAQRAFILSGRTVARQTDLIKRMVALLGEHCAGVFDEMDKDTSLDCVVRAAAAAEAAQADLLISVGAGSVTQGARVVAILMAEKRPIETLITQYPPNAPAISPKLLARKVPIINVLTAATSAQNRGGAGVKDPKRDHRMEFFDPKTRPVALFWDHDALMTAPLSLIRTTTVSVYWRSMINLGAPSMGPLAEGDRLQAFRLAQYALENWQVVGEVTPRIAACTAAFLQNRDADEGGMRIAKNWVSRVVYAFATAIFQQHAQVGQGEANAALTPMVMRQLGGRDPQSMALIAQGLGVWRDGDPLESASEKAACELERVFLSVGMPIRVSGLNIPRESFPAILNNALKNFNADPKREFEKEKDYLMGVLENCW